MNGIGVEAFWWRSDGEEVVVLDRRAGAFAVAYRHEGSTK
jgi:hypothetical protein